MKQLMRNNEKAIRLHTKIDYDRVMAITYLTEFDREVQCALWGYPTESAYYRDASSSDSVLAIRIPFLALHAEDDPVCAALAIGISNLTDSVQIALKEAIPYQEFKQNPHTVLCTTSLGGHLCWFEPNGGRWHAKPVSHIPSFTNCPELIFKQVNNFLNHMAFKVDLDSINNKANGDAEPAKKDGVWEPMRRKMDHCDYRWE